MTNIDKIRNAMNLEQLRAATIEAFSGPAFDGFEESLLDEPTEEIIKQVTVELNAQNHDGAIILCAYLEGREALGAE